MEFQFNFLQFEFELQFRFLFAISIQIQIQELNGNLGVILNSILNFVQPWWGVSGTLECSTGALQDTVLAPFLFTLYTSDFRHSSESCHKQKYSDDTSDDTYITRWLTWTVQLQPYNFSLGINKLYNIGLNWIKLKVKVCFC